MKLQWLIQQVFHEPSLILPSAHASIRSLIENRLLHARDAAQEIDAAREGQDICGESVDLPGMEIKDGIAYIPIAGAIGKGLSGFAKYRGAVDVQDITDELDEAQKDRRVQGIFLDMDTPGGMVLGTPELADKIRQVGAEKPVAAFTDSLMASAGYWLGSAAETIYATKSANIGSIGVYLPHYDMTALYSQHGIKVDLIKSGKHKGIGFAGMPLGESQREHLQERVNQIHAMFKESVTTYRDREIDDSNMQGQVFMGREALESGLIDHLVEGRQSAVDHFRTLLN